MAISGQNLRNTPLALARIPKENPVNKISGVVQAVGRDGKRVQVDGSWYSAFASSQFPKSGVNKGDVVEFTYVQKGEYNNIKGSVEVKAAPASMPTTGAAPSSGSGYTNSRGFVEKQFPVPPLHPDRSIIRQNSLGHAYDVWNMLGDFDRTIPPAEAAAQVIEIARYFEAYSTGDLDNEVAEEAVRAMLASEVNH